MSALTGTLSNEKGILAFIKRNPLTSMYIIMFTVALAWLIALALIVATRGKLGYEPNSEE